MNRRQRPGAALTPSMFFIIGAFILSACSLPRIIVLHDPLTPEEHDNLGRIYESEGKADLALDQYRQALEKNEDHLPSLLLLGDLSYKKGDYSGAESAYRKALKQEPKNGDVMNDLAWVFIRTGKNLDKAKELVTGALSVNPAHRSYYLDTLGVVLLKLGKEKEAIAALQESVAAIPQDQKDARMEAEKHLDEACSHAGNEALCRKGVKKQEGVTAPQ